jgi:protein TonB
MLISKFNVYKDEWLDLVFNDRNKSYGAYELRQHYPQVMVKAMAITFASVLAIIFVFGIILKPVIAKNQPVVVDVPLMPYVPPHKVDPPKPVTAHLAAIPKPPALPAQPAAANRFAPLVATQDDHAENPPSVVDLANKTIGPADTKGTPGPPAIGPVKTNDGGGGSGTIDNSVHFAAGLERMPEPYGGNEAWAKFLRKHLNYPQQAIDEHMQGRVFLSFIIEKDGSISNITVTRGAGYGMDEEALRVLKLAPAWKPGIQNGQPVRVQYNIPINFQLGDND